MTVAPNLASIQSVGCWYEDQERTQPMRYQVCVRQFRRGEWEVMMGSIVTYLSPEDYCDMHQLLLVEMYRGTRHALSHERTELI